MFDVDLSASRRLVLGVSLTGVALGFQARAAGSDPVVMTQYGPVRGQSIGGVNVFKGIRYGGDTGQTRFAKPSAPQAWTEPAAAFEYGAAAPQPGNEANQSEDCLFLNIWSTGLGARAPKAVMVYIHGGAYTTGSGSSPLTDGTQLATDHDVVVVTLNHRLNVFGYLYLEQLAPGLAPDGGNAGQWDLIAALKWLRENIARFGGDPRKIMLFGQSGGGAKIATLMASPPASGLFHSVATMSGQQVTASGPLNATKRARALLDTLRVAPSDVMRLPTRALVEALATLDPIGPDQRIYFGPVLDDRMLSRHPFWPDAPPMSAHIPMILGNVKNETRNLIGRGSPEAFGLGFDDLPMWLSKHMRTDIAPARVIATYRAAYPNMSAPDLFFAATTAARSWRGQVEEADARARQKAPTWVYRLDLPSPDDGGKWGAFHTIDIPHAFKNLNAQGSMTGTGAAARQVSAYLSGAMASLAKRGNPNHRGLSAWPHYSIEKRETLLLDTTTRIALDPRGVERALFATIPFTQWGS